MAYLLCVVPCYNEAARLPRQEFLSFDGGPHRVEFLMVNDGSRDNTLEVLKEMQAASGGRISVLDQPVNGGKAEAVRCGILAALEQQPDYVAYWDADLATPLWEIPRFIEVLEEKPQVELVMGSRVKLLGRKVERKLARHLLGRVFATVVSMSLRLAVYDTQCGAKMFRVNEFTRSLFEQPFLSRWVFDVEIIARMPAHFRRTAVSPADAMYELPLRQWVDVDGSKVKATDFLTAALDVLRIRRRYGGFTPRRD